MTIGLIPSGPADLNDPICENATFTFYSEGFVKFIIFNDVPFHTIGFRTS